MDILETPFYTNECHACVYMFLLNETTSRPNTDFHYCLYEKKFFVRMDNKDQYVFLTPYIRRD